MHISQQLLLVLTSVMVFFAIFLLTLWLFDLWDSLLNLRFQPLLDRSVQLRMDREKLMVLLRWWSLLLTVVPAVLGFGASAWPLAVTWLLLWSGLPPVLLGFLIRRQESLLVSQLAVASRGLSNAVRAGLPVHHGLGSVADETPAPLRGILEQIVYHFERGRPLSEVLKESRRRLQVEAFTMLCLALEVSLERGGQVNQPLEQLTVSLQDWSRIRRRLESETASGRFSVLLMSLAPAGFCVLFWMAGIDAITLFVTDFLGQCVLSAVALLIWAGNRWAARIMCLELS